MTVAEAKQISDKIENDNKAKEQSNKRIKNKQLDNYRELIRERVREACSRAIRLAAEDGRRYLYFSVELSDEEASIAFWLREEYFKEQGFSVQTDFHLTYYGGEVDQSDPGAYSMRVEW